MSEDQRSFLAPSVIFKLHNSPTNENARTGNLTFSPRAGDSANTVSNSRTIPTPNIIAHTSRGSIPHITRDNLARLPNEMLHLSLEHFLDTSPPPFSVAPFSLHRFFANHNSSHPPFLSLALNDVSTSTTGSTTNTEQSCVANTSRGVLQITTKEFLDATLPRPPDLLFAMADDPPVGTTGQMSKKRLEKSLRRSLKHLHEIFEGNKAKKTTNIIAPLVGAGDAEARRAYSKALLGEATSRATANVTNFSSPLDGDIVGYSLKLDPTLDTPSSTPALFQASLEALPKDKVRIVTAANGPHAILRLVEKVGIDFFVESWASECATVGVALDFDFPVSDTQASINDTKLDIGHSMFDDRIATSFIPISNSSLAQPDQNLSSPFAHPFGPSAPTQAYVHHLLHQHELTAHVILGMHNHIIMANLMKSIRSILTSDPSGEKFAKEVEKFIERYDEGGDAFTGNGQGYKCMLAARAEWGRVDKERGKGSLREKAMKALAEEELMAKREQDVKQPLAET